MENKAGRKNKKRVAWIFFILGVLIIALMIRLAYIQLINNEFYEDYANSQQKWDTVIEAARGNIYDRNGKELATSVKCYTLYARTKTVKNTYGDEEINKITNEITEIVGKTFDSVHGNLVSDTSLTTIAKNLNEEQYTAIKALKVSGLELAESVMRYYPYGNFASQLLGSVTDDNTGRSGLELQYDEYLSGVDGRWVKQSDINGNELINGEESYYEAQDGYNVVTTIDASIQYFVEKAISEAQESTGATKVMAIVMNPKTGEILASASTGGFNPNTPLVPDDESELEKFQSMTGTEQTAYLSKLWRNGLVSDTYEPGSTFKPLIASAVLQENLVSTTDKFNCEGSTQISGVTIHCSDWIKHGWQTIKQAIGNSCNVAFSQIVTKLGKTNLYKYLDLYGISSKTGVDYPAESTSIMYKQSSVGPVELATMGYGQGIAVTPIQMISVLNTIANGGTYVKPRYVSALTDSDGNVIKTYDTEVVRKVISEETAEYVRECLQYAVEHGSGGKAKIAGYSIGGKTGTATKISEGSGKYSSSYIASFMGIAPADDPQVSIIVILDSPKSAIYGSAVAAPLAKTILTDVLSYMGIDPEYTDEELEKIQSKYTTVPDVTGQLFSDAIGILGGEYLEYDKSDSISDEDDFEVVDQYPKAGTKVEKGTAVYLYKE